MPKLKASTMHILFIRNFPRDISRVLKSRAALVGQTIPVYLASVLRKALNIAAEK